MIDERWVKKAKNGPKIGDVTLAAEDEGFVVPTMGGQVGKWIVITFRIHEFNELNEILQWEK